MDEAAQNAANLADAHQVAPGASQDDRRALRTRLRRARRAVVDPGRGAAEEALIGRVLSLRRLQESTRVALFLADDGEPVLAPLITALGELGIPMALPGLADGNMDFRPFAVGDELVTGDFGIVEPATDRRLAPGELDVVLTPLVGFDPFGNRIGRGAGYYDRAFGPLRGHPNRPLMIGVAFEVQRVPLLPCEPHDVPLDGIVTDLGVRWVMPGPRSQ